MPYSFTKIEKDKSKTIGLVFSFLIFFYTVSLGTIFLICKNVWFYETSASGSFKFSWLTIPELIVFVLIAGVVGCIHWMVTISGIIDKILGIIGAEPLSQNDKYHHQFKNIVEEVTVATGNVVKIEPVVVPTAAMNAFALSDFDGRHVIGITEGMLARLHRPQTGAAVGHEAAHIVSGDCLATTVSSSIFEMYAGMLKGLRAVFSGGDRRGSYSGGRGGGRVIIFVLLIYLILSVTQFFSYLLRMFISRQREYRADAVATRLTRNPLALAEALVMIAYHWRGQGLSAEELEAIFIVNPKMELIDEKEGFFANMFSTHPPMDSRLHVLLDMAHADLDSVVRTVKSKDNQPKHQVPDVAPVNQQWMVHKEDKWEGPFDMPGMLALDWLMPDTWIQRLGKNEIIMARDEKDISDNMNRVNGEPAKGMCLKCNVPMRKINYEGVQIERCPFCLGSLVYDKDVKRILIREEYGFSDRIRKLGDLAMKESDLFASKPITKNPNELLICPDCKGRRSRMIRSYYTEVYRVETDKCLYCGLTWFDKDELEILQYLLEKANSRNNSST